MPLYFILILWRVIFLYVSRRVGHCTKKIMQLSDILAAFFDFNFANNIYQKPAN